MSSIRVEPNHAEGGYVLKAEEWLPQPPAEVFPFFADATNLEKITPAILRFRVTTPQPITMHEGALVDYKLSIRGISMTWRTRIAVWEPNRRFVDEQLKGPYVRWWHEHTFEASEGGTLCRDRVEYRVPGGPFAPLVHSLLVRRDVERIFKHRQTILRKTFRAPDTSRAQNSG